MTSMDILGTEDTQDVLGAIIGGLVWDRLYFSIVNSV